MKGPEKFDDRFRRERAKQAEYRKQLPADDEPPLPKPVEPIHRENKEIGRNDPCPCGSGKKYKGCCLKKAEKKK